MANVAPAYQASKGSPLDVDRAFYQRIAQEQGARRLVEQLVVPIRSGRAWRVPAGHVFRIVTIDGPQVGDLNIWNCTIRGSGCGRRGRGSFRRRMSARSIGCGRTCRFCGRW